MSSSIDLETLWNIIIDVNNRTDPLWRKKTVLYKFFLDKLRNIRDFEASPDKFKNDIASLFVYLVTICEQHNIDYDMFAELITQKIKQTNSLTLKIPEHSYMCPEPSYITDLNQRKYYDFRFKRGYVGDCWGHKFHAKWFYEMFKPKSILDAGSGSGYFSKYIQEINPNVQVVNLDISSEAFKRKKCGESIIANIVHLPFKDKSFHTLNCNGVLEHLLPEEIKLALDEFERVSEIKFCCMAMGLNSEPVRQGREHQTIVNRVWWKHIIGKRKNWIIGGLEDLDKYGAEDEYGRKGVYTFLNFTSQNLNIGEDTNVVEEKEND